MLIYFIDKFSCGGVPFPWLFLFLQLKVTTHNYWWNRVSNSLEWKEHTIDTNMDHYIFSTIRQNLFDDCIGFLGLMLFSSTSNIQTGNPKFQQLIYCFHEKVWSAMCNNFLIHGLCCFLDCIKALFMHIDLKES